MFQIFRRSPFRANDTPTNCSDLLAEFEITTKPSTIENLDATFSVGRNETKDFLIFESKGPNRNVDYMAGLESLLLGLADYNAVISSVAVDSSASRLLAAEESLIIPNGYNFPLILRHVSDINALRIAITTAAARTARSNDSGGGGNPTKRLRIELATPTDSTLFELQQTLARNDGGVTIETTPFTFKPSKPTQSTDSSERRGIEAGTVAHVHVSMQRSLYSKLITKHGESSVAVECKMASGNPADLVVQTPSGYEIYEIKTSLSPRECVRQAIGQLLEYAHWPTSEAISTLHIVGPREIDKTTESYISILCQTYGLPLQYLCESETEADHA